jgi:hypothetical protein
MTHAKLALLLAVFALPACGAGDIDEDSGRHPRKENTSAGHQAIDEYVMGIPDLVLPQAMPKSESDCSEAGCPQDGMEGDEFCTYRHFTETVHYDKFVAFQPNSATLWPGLVVRGAEAQEGLLTPVGVNLAPVTFSVSLENIANSPVGHMEVPSLSAFREARNEILAGGVTGATPASLDFDVIEVHSESQIAIALGAGVNWPGGPEIAASFDWSSSNKKTKILVNFTQAYYTVDIDTPTTPKDFFDPSVTVEDLAPYADASSPPLSIQSITYGRRVIFSVESNESAETVKAALNASYKGAVEATGSVEASYQDTLSASSIKAFVIGGSGGEATGAISGFEGLVGYITNGGNYSNESPGAPIAYKLAYLDNEVTKLAFTTNYSERECNKTNADMRVSLESIQHIGGDDNGSNLELYGLIAVRYPTTEGNVVSCDQGGDIVALWQLAEGSWQDVAEYSTWKPSSPTYVDLNGVPVGDGKVLCLYGDIWEEDYSTGELSSDDDFGFEARLIKYENGWDGNHVLQLRGPGQNALDVTISVSIE